MVLHQDDDDLQVLLDGGDQLLRHHQVGAVADHDEDVPVGAGHLDAEPAGDLVAHAGVAVLDVVPLRVAGAPQLVQVAGHRPGRAHHDVPRAGELVDRPDHLGLGGQRPVPERVGLLHGRVPGGGQSGRPLLVRRRRRPAGEGSGQRHEGLAGVGDQRDAGVLERVERGHVDVDEPDVRVLERGTGRGGEVAVAGADADHDVRLAGERVRGRRTGAADRADGQRVVVGRASPCRPGSRRPGCRWPRRRRAARRSPRCSRHRRRRRPAAAARSGSRRPRVRARMARAPDGRRATRAWRTAPSGQSCASACTSCGRQTVTAPVSTGSVRTRIAPSSAAGSCSGRQTRSKNLDTGRNASLTVRS